MGTAHLLEPLLGESFAERRAEAKTIPYSLPPSENKREFRKSERSFRVSVLSQDLSSFPVLRFCIHVLFTRLAIR